MITHKNIRSNLRRVALGALVLVTVLGLAGCDSADMDLLGLWADDWATSNNVWDGENLNVDNLAGMAVGEAVDQVLGGPNDPALQAGQVIDDIREADELASQGLAEARMEGFDTAEKHIIEAANKRPNDFTYPQDLATVQLLKGDLDGFANILAGPAQDKLLKQIDNGADCRQSWHSFWSHQVDSIQEVCTGEDCGTGITRTLNDVIFKRDHPEEWPCP